MSRSTLHTKIHVTFYFCQTKNEIWGAKFGWIKNCSAPLYLPSNTPSFRSFNIDDALGKTRRFSGLGSSMSSLVRFASLVPFLCLIITAAIDTRKVDQYLGQTARHPSNPSLATSSRSKQHDLFFDPSKGHHSSPSRSMCFLMFLINLSCHVVIMMAVRNLPPRDYCGALVVWPASGMPFRSILIFFYDGGRTPRRPCRARHAKPQGRTYIMIQVA
jgi:hypothetical protein